LTPVIDLATLLYATWIWWLMVAGVLASPLFGFILSRVCSSLWSDHKDLY
jgi:ABC-type uncharacterized transport system permease subunit